MIDFPKFKGNCNYLICNDFMKISWERLEISPSAFHLWDIAVEFDESLGIDLPGV